MKKLITILAIVTAVASVNAQKAPAKKPAPKKPPAKKTQKAPAPPSKMKCPIMPSMEFKIADAEKNKNYFDYKGLRYYLCCQSCVATFKADPAKHSKNAKGVLIPKPMGLAKPNG
jgi:YHS domain-containing protein